MVWTKYSSTAGSNTSSPPNGAPEGMNPGDVNDTIRDMMAEVRTLGDYTSGAWTNIASAATCNIGAAAQAHLTVTGTTGITAFDTVASGIWRRLRFAAALTWTYNATSMILPGAASITTAAGDTADVVSLGSGNWVCTQFTKAAGPGYQPLDSDLTAIAALTTTAFGRAVLALADAKSLSAYGVGPVVKNYTRDISTASGNQTLTGAGFTPRFVHVIMGQSGNKRSSTGHADGTTQFCVHTNGTAGFTTSNTNICVMAQDNPGVTEYYGSFSSFNSDGMVLGWTKTGTPTGTIDFSVAYYP